MKTVDWTEVAVVDDLSDEWELLPETGFDALLSAYADVADLRRSAVGLGLRSVRVTEQYGDGMARAHVEDFTEQDQHAVDEAANAYLVEAGLPPRPPSFDWFIRRSYARTALGELRSRVVDSLPDGVPLTPSLVRHLIDTVPHHSRRDGPWSTPVPESRRETPFA